MAAIRPHYSSDNKSALSLHGFGFNGHHQLSGQLHRGPIWVPQTLTLAENSLKVVWAGVSETVVFLDHEFYRLSNIDKKYDRLPEEENGVVCLHPHFHSFFGDSEQCRGAVCTHSCQIAFMAPYIPPGSIPSRLIAFEDPRPIYPEICFVATTGRGRCAIIFEYVGENLSSQDTYISEFPSIERMQQWYMNTNHRDPDSRKLPPDALMYVVPGVAKQLVSNTETFTLLLTHHNRNWVYTWGTPSATPEMLGRVLSPLNPPDRPRMIKYLDNPELDITLIRGGGSYSGALNEAEGLVYLWGAPRAPREELTDFAFAGDDFVAVACPGERQGPLPRIRDFDIGAEHMALLDRKGRVFVAGSNRLGQLGLGDEVTFSPAWRRAARALEPYVVAVSCAAYCTYVVVDEAKATWDERGRGAGGAAGGAAGGGGWDPSSVSFGRVRGQRRWRRRQCEGGVL